MSCLPTKQQVSLLLLCELYTFLRRRKSSKHLNDVVDTFSFYPPFKFTGFDTATIIIGQ